MRTSDLRKERLLRQIAVDAAVANRSNTFSTAACSGMPVSRNDLAQLITARLPRIAASIEAGSSTDATRGSDPESIASSRARLLIANQSLDQPSLPRGWEQRLARSRGDLAVPLVFISL